MTRYQRYTKHWLTSEHFGGCWSYYDGCTCPKCQKAWQAQKRTDTCPGCGAQLIEDLDDPNGHDGLSCPQGCDLMDFFA